MGYKFEKYSIGGGGSGVGEYINMECYLRSGAYKGNYFTLEKLFIGGGMSPAITYYVVDALPESPNVTNLATANPTHIYIYNDVPYVYTNAGNGDMWMGITDVLALSNIIVTAKGFTADITEETEIGVYVTYQAVSKETIDGLNERLDTAIADIVDLVAGLNSVINLSKYPIGTINFGFRDNQTVRTVILPQECIMIGSWAFKSCVNLEYIQIPVGLVNINVESFYGCIKLANITYNGTKAQWKAISFGADWDQNTGNYTIYCTDGTIAKDGTES